MALEAVREAAGACRTVQQGVDALTLEKDDRSPVTVADFASQALVARSLARAFPDDPLVGEEDAAALRAPDQAARRAEVHARVSAVVGEATVDDVLGWIDRGGARPSAGRTWVLDPVDGTKGFLRGEQYAVALALLVEGQPQVAALACPNLPLGPGADSPVGCVFTAMRGEGASMAPLFEAGPAHPIRVSEQSEAAALRLCESVESGHSAHDQSARLVERMGIEADPVRLDSQAKYGVVARGDAELYLRLPTRPGYQEKVWDHAAGVLVVEEAGGVVTDVDGRPLDFRQGRTLARNRGVVVSHGSFHARVLALLHELNV